MQGKLVRRGYICRVTIRPRLAGTVPDFIGQSWPAGENWNKSPRITPLPTHIWPGSFWVTAGGRGWVGLELSLSTLIAHSSSSAGPPAWHRIHAALPSHWTAPHDLACLPLLKAKLLTWREEGMGISSILDFLKNTVSVCIYNGVYFVATLQLVSLVNVSYHMWLHSCICNLHPTHQPYCVTSFTSCMAADLFFTVFSRTLKTNPALHHLK